MWIYIIGYIVSFVILYFIYKFFNYKFTYRLLAQIVLISIFSWIGVVLEIVFIVWVALMAISIYLSEMDFWDKEIFKRK